MVERWLQTFPDVDSAIARLEAHDVPCAPVLSVEETITHPHLVERGTVRTIRDPIAGEFAIPGMPVKSSAYPADLAYVAPRLGEHNREVLRDILGKTAGEIEAFENDRLLHSGEV